MQLTRSSLVLVPLSDFDTLLSRVSSDSDFARNVAGILVESGAQNQTHLKGGIPHIAKTRVNQLEQLKSTTINQEAWQEAVDKERNHFFNQTRALVTFGLNALQGRHLIKRGVWGGDWNSTNARDFIKYTVSKGYQIDSWEFGNELSGEGIGAMVNADQYGIDVIELREIIDNSYRRFRPKPLLIAPGGFFDKSGLLSFLKFLAQK
ncbi:glucuronidase 1 [Artemisia annua]|uniref:Glucuronidase 1 n=1 Tax=Artemisia annua TaxID=35608 RepID=A0A2U1NXD9_ARTAN|nr:glucuronidase 1 [Artemisia annua]